MDENLKTKYNLRSPSVKRLMREAMELREPNNQYHAQPLEDNLFEWHFTVRGPPDSDFDTGRYHGRIILPPEYPMKPPSIILLTPNGRFETGKKICLSMSAHHPEGWQPSWSIRTVLLALIGFMPSKGGGAIGALDYTTQERLRLAQRSTTWTCDVCLANNGELLPEVSVVTNEEADREAKELASQIDFKGEVKGEGNGTEDKGDPKPASAPGASAVVDGQAQQAQNPFPNLFNPYYFQYQMPMQPGVAPSYGWANAPQPPAQPSPTNGNQPGTTGESPRQPLTSVAGNHPIAPNSDRTGLDNPVEDISDRPSSAEVDSGTSNECRNPDVLHQSETVPSQPRQRNLPRGNAAPAASANDQDRRSRSRQRDNDGGYVSLVMLWLVTLSLVALILRRLCMEALNINPQG